MALIPIYEKGTDDYSGNGLGLLTPIESTVYEQAAGEYELTLVQPIDETLRWAQIQAGCKVKAEVPIRESPIYEKAVAEGGSKVTREIYQVVRTSVGVRLRTGPGTGYKRLSTHKNGTLVVKIDQPNSSWMHVVLVDGGAEGYMFSKYLEFYRTETEEITPEKPTGNILNLSQARDQLFTIYSVETDTADRTVTAKAMHAFYDQRGNIIDAEYEPEKTDISTVVSEINSKLFEPNPISWHAQNISGEVSGVYSHKSPIEAYLDPDEGIVKQTKALLIRDNFNAYLLPDKIRDRGVTVRRRKNLKGVHVTHDESNVVTRIIPVGKNKDGDPLYLHGEKYPNKYIDSKHIGDYPQVMIKRIEYDVSVGKPNEDNKNTVFKTEAEAMAELERLARLEFDEKGIDLPDYGMEVDFVLLQNTKEYANYASLQSVHLYDTVTIVDELIGLTAKLRVTAYKWNVNTKQYDLLVLGELLDVSQMVYSYNLPDGGVSGTKIAPNSMSGTALRNATIQYAKISNAAIEQLSAQAITALTARIGEIVADKITTDELYSVFAEMIALKVGSITAEDIETDRLAAALANITVLIAGTASFDQATIQHLVAQAMNLEFGTAGQVFIKNLAVEYAQMVGAAIGELCIKASDGNYYLLDVKADGTVSATLTTVTEGEISAGKTEGGQMILETNITAANLNTGNLLATYALVNQIDAARIDVDQLFAREAFIALLRTVKIIGDKSIEMIAEDVDGTAKVFRQASAPQDGVRENDLWVIPGTERVYQATITEVQPTFYIDENGVLSAEFPEGFDDGSYSVTIQGRDLVTDGFILNTVEGGVIGDGFSWVQIGDRELADAVSELQHSVFVKPDGLHVQAEGSGTEVVIDSNSVDIRVGGVPFSSFGSNYVEFGDYQMRRTADGGLAFKRRRTYA